MDYSNKGILVMLQDLQRINFGKVGIYVDTVLSDDGDEPIVSGTVFDKEGEAHFFSFHSFESEEKHKEGYLKLLELVNETAE